MKVTKKNIRLFVKEKLSSDDKWAVKALVRIFKENQTAEEKVFETTIVENGIGFTGADGEILSSFANQQIKFGRLSEKQMKIVHKKMPKYWSQVISMADEAKLNKMAANHLQENQMEINL